MWCNVGTGSNSKGSSNLKRWEARDKRHRFYQQQCVLLCKRGSIWAAATTIGEFLIATR